MRKRRDPAIASRPALVTGAALASAMLALAMAGCGSPPAASRSAVQRAALPGRSLDTSTVTATGTWAVVVMGGSAARHDNFWQLFFRAAASSRWRLVTPPGTADNGGLVLADVGGQSVITAFLPSQMLRYTPLAKTSDAGQAWSALSPLGARLASSPDALALAPGGARLLALLAGGTVTTSAPGYATWTSLTSERALAATPAGKRCGLRGLTAAAVTPAGTPLLAGACTRPGVAAIFAPGQHTWTAAGPALPPALTGQAITVLRLTRTASQAVALLAAGSGRAASLVVAWSAGTAGHWTLSPPLPLAGAAVASASFGPGGIAAIALTDGRGELVGTGHQWQALPPLPDGTATLAAGPGKAIDALTVSGATLGVWQVQPGGPRWIRTQRTAVPIQYGSSG